MKSKNEVVQNENPISKKQKREKTIIKTSVIGILGNILLSAFKATIGFFTNSIAITLDAVNNLSDAFSSVITIVGTKLASKPADKKHPFGYGRIEYLSALIISVIILYAGLTSLVESAKKIIHPETPNYTTLSIIIVAVAVLVKISLGLYFKHVGKKVNSDSLIASGKDALMDSIISITTIIAAIVYIFAGVKLEAYLGILISIMILKAGFESLRDTISEILGERASETLVHDIKETISHVEGVRGVYDLVLNNYGPDSFLASVHIEVDDEATAVQIDNMQWQISKAVYEKYNVTITAVGIYPSNTGKTKAAEIKTQVSQYLSQYPEVLQMHGFYLNEEEKILRMDVIIDFNAKNRINIFEKIQNEIASLFPQYHTVVILDLDISAS